MNFPLPCTPHPDRYERPDWHQPPAWPSQDKEGSARNPFEAGRIGPFRKQWQKAGSAHLLTGRMTVGDRPHRGSAQWASAAGRPSETQTDGSVPTEAERLPPETEARPIARESSKRTARPERQLRQRPPEQGDGW